ncbi:acyltransferase family protein [Alteromonas flava]|uniref:acyltransferase family protein n=1 Tax=Alteromonas flava TaxID=2048003 RepID=UPI000C288514|nr:acyltransferase [Alteromonas flava]
MNLIPRENHFIWMRYLAAFSIMLSHSRQFNTAPDNYSSIAATLTWLYPGVPVLFFISGFLISLSSTNSKSLTEFLVKRVLRIYPPLWAAFGVSVVTIFATGMVQFDTLNWLSFIAWSAGQLTFVFFYHPDFLSHVGTGVFNCSLWVIPVILQFYLVAPMLGRIDRKWQASNKPYLIYGVLLACAIFNIVFHYFHNHHTSNVTKVIHFLTFLPWLFFFVLGYVFARDFRKIQPLFKSATFWVICHLVLFYLLNQLGFKWGRNDINPLLFVFLAMFVMSIGFKPQSKFKAFNQLENTLGRNDISFGLFVYHMAVLNTIMYLGVFESNWFARCLLFFGVTIAVSTASLFLLEKPIRNRRDSIIALLTSRQKKSSDPA